MRDIECFDIKKGYYGITEDGKVYSKIYKRYLMPKLMKDGYLDLLLVCEDGKRRHFIIHRLVAATYLENTNNDPIVLHLDNNKTNNHYTNLKWGTIQENTQQAYDDGCCSWNKPVYLYDRTYKYVIKRFNSICDLAKYLGYNKGNETTLGKYCKGELPMPNKGKLKNYIISHERL